MAAHCCEVGLSQFFVPLLRRGLKQVGEGCFSALLFFDRRGLFLGRYHVLSKLQHCLQELDADVVERRLSRSNVCSNRCRRMGAADSAATFRATRFSYFEGFDQPFKESFPTPWEPFWGLFRHDRTTKRFISKNRP